jgi:hypothetical protein
MATVAQLIALGNHSYGKGVKPGSAAPEGAVVR